MAFKSPRISIATISAGLLTIAAALFILMAFNNTRLYSVQSGSMAPSINEGDLLLASGVSEKSIRPGDVITYINPENRQQTITHRVLETPSENNQSKFITKGDANNITDRPLASEFILGKTVFSVPYAGHFLDFARHPAGLVLLIYIPAIVILAGELRRLADYYRSQRPYYASEAIRRQLLSRYSPEEGGVFNRGLRNLTVVVLFAVSLFSAQVYAATLHTTTLSSNRISVAKPSGTSAPELKPKKQESETNARVQSNIHCINNIELRNNVNQTSETGDAVSLNETNAAVDQEEENTNQTEQNSRGSAARSGDGVNSSEANISASAECGETES